MVIDSTSLRQGFEPQSKKKPGGSVIRWAFIFYPCIDLPVNLRNFNPLCILISERLSSLVAAQIGVDRSPLSS